MNTQELIQALIKDKLFDAACMYTHEKNDDKVGMLLTCAVGEYVNSSDVFDVMWELHNNKELYK